MLTTEQKEQLPKSWRANEWEPTVWPFCTDPEILASFDCYRFRTADTPAEPGRTRGFIYLQVVKNVETRPNYDTPPKPYTPAKYKYGNSQGLNSDHSHSGCLPSSDNGFSLEDARFSILLKVMKWMNLQPSSWSSYG